MLMREICELFDKTPRGSVDHDGLKAKFYEKNYKNTKPFVRVTQPEPYLVVSWLLNITYKEERAPSIKKMHKKRCTFTKE